MGDACASASRGRISSVAFIVVFTILASYEVMSTLHGNPGIRLWSAQLFGEDIVTDGQNKMNPQLSREDAARRDPDRGSQSQHAARCFTDSQCGAAAVSAAPHTHTVGPEMASEWIHFPTIINETSTIMSQVIARNRPCHQETTTEAKIFGLPTAVNGRLRLPTGSVHKFTIVSYNKTGNRRCAGGDYYETDLTGNTWKSRPPVVDMFNGTYTVSLQVDSRHAGIYVFKVVLLFENWQGLNMDWIMHADQNSKPLPWARSQEIATLQIEFFLHSSQGLGLQQCQPDDFNLNAWSGRWTRDSYNASCEKDDQARFRCLPPQEPCQSPWCLGPIGLLESNGWVYSAHCRLKIFDEEAAWSCLNNKWWFFWGDSNFQDSVRNLLNYILGFNMDIGWMERRFDTVFKHPTNASRTIRITSMYNGHVDEKKNYQGLSSLKDARLQKRLRSFFTGPSVPDAVLLNSGLHDGVHWRALQTFVEEGVNPAARFWGSVLSDIDPSVQPVVVYRTTVAGGGNARVLDYNPQKMELYNHIIVETLQRLNIPNLKIVDAFDLTFPWHWDNECNDGVHYGRAPPRGRDHKYFVDLMLLHTFLNAICPV